MREIFTSGSVGRALGNQRLYPEPDYPKLRRSYLALHLWATGELGVEAVGKLKTI
jgi:hypothetical protein